jgi:uncharacterized protein with PQ loop repeat
MAVLVLVLAARHHRTVGRTISRAVLCTLVALGIAVLSVATNDHSIISFLAVSGAFCLYLPQLRHVVRSQSISGVSLTSWLLALGASISWGIYGLTIHQLAVSLPSVVLIPSATLIVARILTNVQPADD